MPKRKRKIVDLQDLDERDGSVHSYERYRLAQDGRESVLANPDSLLDQPHVPSTPQLLMGEAIEHLQGRQKQVYLLHMREDMSFAEVGEALDMSKSNVQGYLNRAIAFITAYCKMAIDGGRV